MPEIAAPFRLRRLHLHSGDVDVAAIAWTCGASVDTLQHLILDTDYSTLLDEMENVDNLRAEEMARVARVKNVLAVLPRLTLGSIPAPFVEQLLRYIPRLLHLETEIDELPPLNSLPSSLHCLRLVVSRPRTEGKSASKIAAFIASLPRNRPPAFNAHISFEQLPQNSDQLDRLVWACTAVGLRVSSS